MNKMRYFQNIVFLQIFCNSLITATAQYCVTFKPVVKTRIQWNNGQRLVSKRNFFGGIKYKYEPYMYSSVQSYHDYERVTVCCDGYREVGDIKCEPVCNPPCPSNTHCIRPDICECDWGYRGFTASAKNIQCEAFCKPNCDPNADCIAPNKCQCRSGYEDADGSGQCQPICKTPCPVNSQCTKPDLCACDSGYLDNGLGVCQPQCTPRCPDFSDCTKPNSCVCHENYKAEEGLCRPVCEQQCPEHAICIRPNECECLTGYELIDKAENGSFSCMAKCNETCPAFSRCTQPNKCECNSGYNKTETEQNLCSPVCQNGCPEHSNCTAPNTCSCEKGYEMIEEQCQPICEKPCPEHSTCSEPNKCLCSSGYQLKLSSIYNLYCEPVCPSNCSTFGKCVQPNKCECLEGYQMDEFDTCRPVCSKGCRNGLCFQPEICVCKPGYLMGPRQECEPVCSMACQNGSCVEPEICQCHDGYQFQDNSVNLCEPVCEDGCINGICVAPNVCICHENFEPEQMETGLNHNNCQLMHRFVTPTETTMASNTYTTATSSNMTTLGKHAEPALTRKPYPESFRHTTSKPLVAAPSCNDMCQCWQEYDEFGPLTYQQCVRLCVDDFDKPCLDLKLCQCDLITNRLVCIADEEDLISDDPIYYVCTMPRVKTITTLQPLEESMKGFKPKEASQVIWWWLIVLGLVTVMCLLGFFMYLYLRRPGDSIIEYEL